MKQRSCKQGLSKPLTNISTSRLSHHEFLKRYSLALKHLNPVTRSHVTLPQAHSPKKADASPRVPAVERLKRRSRRRHRSSYDHTRHICQSIMEVVQIDSDEGKENLHAKDSDGVKIGRTKIFLREEAVRLSPSELTRPRVFSGVQREMVLALNAREEPGNEVVFKYHRLKELCHDILSQFCEAQNHLQTEESLQIIVYYGRKTLKR